MTEELVLGIGREALLTTVLIAAPLLLGALITGLVVSILQAVTQINEATLTFIPKIGAVVLILLVLAPWMIQVMTAYTTDLFTSLPGLVR